MPKKNLPNASSRSDKKINAIAAAAAKLFSTRGYIETSMEDIAAAAKMSKGGMYHYFSNKRDILNFILSTFMELVLGNIERDLQNLEDPAEKIRFIIRRHVEIYCEHVYEAKVLLNEAHNLSTSKLKKIKSKERLYFSAISGVLSSYVGHQLDKDRLTVITFNLLAMCNWIYSWYNPLGAINPEQLSQIIFDTIINYPVASCKELSS
jgi:TetR/AcrR family transcriptional regulator, cholesterol catabolism regulator